MTLEVWRPVSGFEKLYEVSNLGRVRNIRRGRMLHLKRGAQGHLSVRLCRAGVHVWRGVHCLVLEAFKGPCPAGMQGCHNDGNPANNVPANLRWDTPAGNAADRIAHGTSLHGERNSLSKLTANDIAAIRERSQNGELGKHIAAAFGVTPANISSIINRKTWAHVQ